MAAASVCRSRLMASAAALTAGARRSALSGSRLSWRVRGNGSTMPARTFVSGSRLQEKKYTEDHEWIELSADGKTGTIGITQYAAKALGDIVFVELPEVGLELAAKDTMGAVESVKSASDLYAPIGGTIVEKNSALEDKPGTINKGPEGDGWIAKIEIAEGEDMSALMDAEAYRKHTEE